jgi:Uma2 family endonuclease
MTDVRMHCKQLVEKERRNVLPGLVKPSLTAEAPTRQHEAIGLSVRVKGMTMTLMPPILPGGRLPDHTQLPDTDGSIVQNFQEHPQAMLLTDTIRPVLGPLHPDSQYAIGQDSGIYWRYTDPPLEGCKAPDWFYVPDVPPLLDGQVRRSYVMWREGIPPVLLVEFVSGDGSEERDTTPQTGKFWVYERGIRADYYAIYEVDPGRVELYRLVNRRYQRVAANQRDHFPVEPLGVELGIWRGRYMNMELPWLRWWDAQGRLLLTSDERNERLRERNDRLAAKLRELGVDPDTLS